MISFPAARASRAISQAIEFLTVGPSCILSSICNLLQDSSNGRSGRIYGRNFQHGSVVFLAVIMLGDPGVAPLRSRMTLQVKYLHCALP